MKPVISCDQASCAVVWEYTGDLKLRWLFLDGGTSEVSTRRPLLSHGSAVWNGKTMIVADSSGTAGDQNVYLLTAQRSGDPLSAAEQRVLGCCRVPERKLGFAATANVGLMAWNQRRPSGLHNVRLRRLASDGGYLDASPVEPVQGGHYVDTGAVVEFGGLFYVLFFDMESTVQHDPYLTIWSETGPVAERIALALTRDDEVTGTLAVSGNHLLATWQRNADVELTRFSFDGGRLGAARVLSAAFAPALSMHGTSGFFGVLRELSDGGQRLELDVLHDENAGFTLTSLFEQDAVTAFALAAQDVGVSWVAMTTLNDAGVSRIQALRLDLNTLPSSGADDGGSADGGGATDGGESNAGATDGGQPELTDGGTQKTQAFRVGCGCASAQFDVIGLLIGFRLALGRWRQPRDWRSGD
jgi:hypothetical protein